jgi:hypothetical protein
VALTRVSQTKFALNMISIIGLGLVKSSILVMYKNIFAVRKFQIVVYTVLAFVVGWTVSFSISHLFTCYPITVFIEPYYNNKCVETVPMFLALLVSIARQFFFFAKLHHGLDVSLADNAASSPTCSLIS